MLFRTSNCFFVMYCFLQSEGKTLAKVVRISPGEGKSVPCLSNENGLTERKERKNEKSLKGLIIKDRV